MNKVQSWNIITLFCVLIFGFAIATLISPDTEYSETENRTLAQMPEATLSSLTDGSFESDYEDYLTDQFVLRDEWIALKTNVERLMGRTSSNDIFFADDDYLIEAHTDTFTSDQAETNIQILAQFVEKYVGTFGTDHMTVMIVPNAVDILHDKLPAFASPYDEGEYLEQIEAALMSVARSAYSDSLLRGIWFDARSVLQEHSEEEIYYRTDHHWTTLGAFYVYQAWAEEQGYTVPTADSYLVETVTEEFEGTIQSKLGIHTVTDSIELYLDPSDPYYTVEKDGSGEISYSLYDYTALETKSKYDIFFGGNNALTQITTHAGTGRKILVVKDSYAHCFVPFLLSEFDEIDVLDIRYYNQEISKLIEEEGYTDLLFLYNASGFAEDTSLAKLLY
ncbi:MAG: hypothetical protein LUG93_17645 [Lachnospiraceae bacterium]|nr:hypothetical protein [Lachnospiraceae bacterium]